MKRLTMRPPEEPLYTTERKVRREETERSRGGDVFNR